MHAAMARSLGPLALLLIGSSTLLAGCLADGPPAGPRGSDAGTTLPGIDASIACTGETVACGTSCVDLVSDVRHCGQCDRACGTGEVCSAGACSADGCGTGTTDCSGSCVDTQRSSLHCGGCGNACPSGTTCVAGECACGGGLSLCDGRCVDTTRDAANCGGCGQPCATGESCQSGACAACGTGVSFARDVQPILTGNCTGAACHGGVRPAGDLSLEAGRAHAELVGVPSGCMDRRLLVTAGEVGESYLVNKITGADLCGGNQMPLGRAALSTAQIDVIRDWICGGARDD